MASSERAAELIPGPDDGPTTILEERLAELENQVRHLERSNAEMAEFDPDGTDADLVAARDENAAVLARKGKEIARLREEIAQAMPSAASAADSGASAGLAL